jgi:hypothetical protein
MWHNCCFVPVAPQLAVVSLSVLGSLDLVHKEGRASGRRVCEVVVHITEWASGMGAHQMKQSVCTRGTQ